MNEKPKNRAAWWWIDRWRKSTAYTDMTVEERGAYRELLDELWLRGGTIPNDDRILARIVGDPEAWKRVKKVVLARFIETPEGLTNETHDEVAAGSNRLSESQSEKGKKGALKRWGSRGNDGPANSSVNSPANSPAIRGLDGPANGLPSPSPSPSPLQEQTPEKNQGRSGADVPRSTPASKPAVSAPPGSSSDGPLTPERLGVVFDAGVIQQRNLARDLAALTERTAAKGEALTEVALGILQAISTTQRGGKAIDSLDLRGISPAWCAVTSHAARKFALDQGFELPP